MKMNTKSKDYYNNISEDECYDIGLPEKKRFNKKKILIALLTIIATLFCAALITLLLQLTVLQPKLLVEPAGKHLKPLGKQNLNIEYSYTEKLDTIIEGLSLTLYIPHNAIPAVTTGSPDTTNLPEETVLAFRAADLHSNDTLDDRFVCDGVVYPSDTTTSSKLGFCTIIDNIITIGTAESTSLFEKAIERKGSFFRQHSLVADGKVTANMEGKVYKNITFRRALCQRGDEVFVVACNDVSMRGLAQALAALEVDNAIYLLAGKNQKSFNGWWRDVNDSIEFFRKTEKYTRYKYESYIVWKKVQVTSN